MHTFIARSGASDVHMAAVVLHFPGEPVGKARDLRKVSHLVGCSRQSTHAVSIL